MRNTRTSGEYSREGEALYIIFICTLYCNIFTYCKVAPAGNSKAFVFNVEHKYRLKDAARETAGLM